MKRLVLCGSLENFCWSDCRTCPARTQILLIELMEAIPQSSLSKGISAASLITKIPKLRSLVAELGNPPGIDKKILAFSTSRGEFFLVFCYFCHLVIFILS